MIILHTLLAKLSDIVKNESRIDKVKDAVQKACDTAKPEDKNEVLDQLIMDIWKALYK